MLLRKVLCKLILTWRNSNLSHVLRSHYHQFNRSVTVLNRVLQIFCGPMTQMSPKRGYNNRETLKEQGSIVILALRSFACKSIFRSALSCIFLFQHVCVGRIAGSEDFRLGIRVGKRIEGVFVARFFQLLALESLFLRRDRRKWSRFPDWKPEERISL